MKTSTFITATAALVVLSFDVSAAPPGGGGGSPMGGGGMPTGISNHADTDRAVHGQSGTTAVGRSVSDQLADNAKLASEIKELTGNGAQDACAGFKNLGDCVAAAHVSKNLGIPFDTLHSKLTGSGAVSLGKAIHELKPDADAKSATREASRQSKADLKGSG
jgi:hypothetical protein